MLKFYYNGEEKPLQKIHEIWNYAQKVYTFEARAESENAVIYPITPADFTARVKKVKSSPIKGSALYFDGTSDFPRFKLQDSKFKRVIKLDKADQVVVSGKSITNIHDQYGTTDNMYIIKEGEDFFYIPGHLKCRDQRPGENIIDAINRHANLFPSKDIVYSGKALLYVRGNKAAGLAKAIYENEYSSVIYDDELDETVSGGLESLDNEAITSISEMLNSEDESIVGMGLKLIPNYNILEYPLTIKTILRIANYKIERNKIWTSTALKQLRSTIDYQPPYSSAFPACLQGIVDKSKTYSDQDRAFAKSIILAKVESTLDKLSPGLKEVCDRYNIKIYADER